MATTITNTENDTISMYWNTLRSMSKNIRLALAVKLTNSVLEEEREEISDAAYNKECVIDSLENGKAMRRLMN